MAADEKKLKVGDVVGIYEVVKTEHFGPLPLAKIRPGGKNEERPNVGLTVILTSAERKS